jgi:2-methylcitrate dehydratase PrpD
MAEGWLRDGTARNYSRLSRRGLLEDGSLVLAGVSLLPLVTPAVAADMKSVSPVMLKLSEYMSEAKDHVLPDEVLEKAKQHILDTLAAMISGSELAAGREAVKFARAYGGKEIATVVGSNILCGPIEAALTNGMLAHSDETDDSHAPSQSHPGCAVVPAALAAGEQFGISGAHFLRAVALGYDVGTRSTMTLGAEPYESSSHRSTHSIATTFGASAAAGCAASLTAQQIRWVLNYAAEQSSGLSLWNRDTDHIEKAFDFAGGPARNGVTSAMVVRSGWTGVDDVFSGPHNFFLAFNPKADPAGLIAGLGTQYEVARTDIKRWTVGMPLQAPLDALQNIRKQNPLSSSQVKEVVVRLAPGDGAVVDDSELPDVCLQHIMATMLLDNTVTFRSAHDKARMQDPAILRERAKVRLVPDEELGRLMPRRQSIVEVTLIDGTSYREHVDSVRGTAANPMTSDEVKAKARDLILPVLGEHSASRLIDQVFALEKVKDIRELRRSLQK